MNLPFIHGIGSKNPSVASDLHSAPDRRSYPFTLPHQTQPLLAPETAIEIVRASPVCVEVAVVVVVAKFGAPPPPPSAPTFIPWMREGGWEEFEKRWGGGGEPVAAPARVEDLHLLPILHPHTITQRTNSNKRCILHPQSLMTAFFEFIILHSTHTGLSTHMKLATH